MYQLDPRDQRRIHRQLRIEEAARARAMRGPCPYFAHLCLDYGDRTTDFLLAPEPVRRDAEHARDLVVVDWQRSPVAEIFFLHAEGDAVHLEGMQRQAKVAERNLLSFREGRLVEITTPDGVLRRTADDSWVRADPIGCRLAARGKKERTRVPTLIDVTLDPAQERVVKLPAGRSVLILGEAGHGKTTVALHRLAELERNANHSLRAAILVPTEGLRKLLIPTARRLGIDVEVNTYERWAADQAREAFADIPERESQDATAGVIRIKRDPGLATALAVLAKRRAGRIDDNFDAPRVRTRAWARYADLQHLFGDRRLMQNVAKISERRITAIMINELLEHTHVQFSERTEREYAHIVGRRRLMAVDGQPLDEGTPMEDAESIDTEDYAVLFELDRLRAERRGKVPTQPKPYDIIVLDEAQEFASLELSLIGRSLAPGGTLIVAGDADQQMDPAACFKSWSETMAALRCAEYEEVLLEVGYRCPASVVAVARSLTQRAPSSDGTCARDLAGTGGAHEVPFLAFPTECHLASWLKTALEPIEQSDRRASVAVICKSQLTARRLARVLGHGIRARFVHDGNFAFNSGVNVTSVDQVKGLEFDYVIVPDASALAYPESPASRRALYVAATRARFQLVLATTSAPTPIVSAAG